MFAGRFKASQSHYEKVLALRDSVTHRSLIHQIGICPRVTAQGQSGLDALCLGFPNQALALSRKAIAEARRLDHAPTLASCLAVDALLFALIENYGALQESRDELVAVTRDQGFAFWGSLGTIYSGCIRIANGDVTKGIPLLRSGLIAFRANGMDVWTPCYITFLAKAYALAEQVEEALAMLDDAVQIIERTRADWFKAELLRHKGQLLLRHGHAEAAEELYREALTIAREQEAKFWELRTAGSIARLCRHQGRRSEARDMLAPVYGWFTKGFDTPDLKEARGLLDELGGTSRT